MGTSETLALAKMIACASRGTNASDKKAGGSLEEFKPDPN